MSAIYLSALLVPAGILILLWGLAPLGLRADPVDQRVEFYGAKGRQAAIPELRDESFRQRMVDPQLLRLRTAALRLTPADYQARLARDLELAGLPAGVRSADFLIVRMALALTGFGLGAILAGLFARGPLQLLGGAVAGLALFAAPRLALRLAIGQRRERVHLALPGLIDFLVVAVDAGLGIDAALARVCDKYRNPLTEGIAQALAEVNLGRPRAEALAAYGRRCGVEDVNTFLQTLTTSQGLGVPVSRVLHVQADEIRWKRREEARRKGAQAPIRMMIPMIVFVFPTLWLVLLGPILFQLFQSGL